MSIQCPTCLTDNFDNVNSCTACGTPLVSNISTSTYHLPNGTLLKKGIYKVEEVLGEGGFGITYKGISLKKSTHVAIKELWIDKAARIGTKITWPSSITPVQQQQQLKKFKLEASYLQKCIHPNIAQVYEWFEENNTAYIIMEFISGKTLYKILKEEGVQQEKRVINYFVQIAEALKVIHTNNLLHRDIKPDNILVDNNNKAVLIDFGATKEFIAGQTSEMSKTLTRGYAPLEQYSYRGKRFPATDIYALCASMYELLTETLPPDATDIVSGSQELIAPRQLRPNLSVLIEKVILTGMQLNVGNRFQTADELIDALHGNFVSPNHKKAQKLVEQGKLTEAVKAYENHLKGEPDNADAMIELASVQMHIDDSQAEYTANKASLLKPNEGRIFGILGLIECRKSNWSKALKNLQKAAKLSPQEIWIQANLAWTLGKCGNWQQAELIVNKALKLDSNCTFALGLQAWIAVNQQKWKLSIRTATQAIFTSKQTSCENAQQLKDWVYPHLIFSLDKAATIKQGKDIERRIQEFIDLVPNNSFAWGFRGWKQGLKNLWTDAIFSFEQASCKSQSLQWVLINKGITQEHLHNFQAAIQTYELYIQQFMPSAFVLFRLGTLHGQIEQWKKAQSYLERAVKQEPNYAEAYHNLGWVLLKIKDQNGNLVNFRKILSVYSKASELYSQQKQQTLEFNIKQAFQSVGINSF